MNPRREDEEPEWFSDDELWETTYPLMFPEKRFADSPRETDDILALIGRSSGNVLDLGCGPARISALLAQRGFTVTGVDRSPFLLARAKERVASLGVSLELVHSDMRVEDIPGGLFIQRRRPVDTWSRMDNEWIIIRDGVQRSFRLEHWIYSGREISQMMTRAGFADVRVFGDYAGSPYGPAAKRLVVVATKDGQPPR
jgi:SAM-dependent methyltransferase